MEADNPAQYKAIPATAAGWRKKETVRLETSRASICLACYLNFSTDGRQPRPLEGRQMFLQEAGPQDLSMQWRLRNRGDRYFSGRETGDGLQPR